jgi:transposase
MLGLFPPPARIYLYAKNVDMRKSFDGLLAIIQTEFQKDVRQGDLFLFLNRRLDRLKLMGWDRDGLSLFTNVWRSALFSGRLPSQALGMWNWMPPKSRCYSRGLILRA